MKLLKSYPRTSTTTTHQKDWSRIMRCLGRFLDDYNDPPRDAAYWYGERALTGLIAAAGWKLNCWSLEEFTGVRWKGQKEKTGKGDAWVESGSTTFTIEAKVRWPRDTSIKSWENSADGAIEEATQQLKDLDPDYKKGSIKAAVCYLVPQIHITKFSQNKKDVLEAFKSFPGTDHGAELFATSYWYPKNPPASKSPDDGKLYVYPGLVVVARFRERI